MQTTDVGRPFAMPSALVLSELLDGHGGNPPVELMEQAGFDRNEADRFLRRRVARCERSNSACASS